MKKMLVVLTVLALVLGACASATDNAYSSINGTWTLANVAGVPATTLGMSGTMTVTGGNSFSNTLTSAGKPAIMTGTVTSNGNNQYTFTPATGTAAVFTMSTDGRTLTSSPASGSVAYTR